MKHDLTTNSGYMASFWERVQDAQQSHHPMRDALKSVESDLRQQHGVQRYSTYRSFSTVKGRKRSGPCRLRPVQ